MQIITICNNIDAVNDSRWTIHLEDGGFFDGDLTKEKS